MKRGIIPPTLKTYFINYTKIRDFKKLTEFLAKLCTNCCGFFRYRMAMAFSNLQEVLMVKISKQCVESNLVTQSSVLSID